MIDVSAPRPVTARIVAVLAAAMATVAGAHESDDSLRTMTERLSDHCELVVRVGEDSESCWSQVCASTAQRDLGCDLSAMRQVVTVSASPDRKWLAVLSVGEGHPMLEVVALDALLEQREYRVMTTINPYPGTIGISGWRDGELRVTSDMPLPELPLTEGDPAARMGASDDAYALDLSTWKIHGVEPANSQAPGAAD